MLRWNVKKTQGVRPQGMKLWPVHLAHLVLFKIHVKLSWNFLHRDWHCSVHYVTLYVMLTYTQLYYSYCARTSKNLHAVQIFWDELYQYNEGNFEMNTNNTDLIRFKIFFMLCKNRTIRLNQTVGTSVTHQFLDSKLIESIVLLLSLIGEYSNPVEFM